MKSALARLPCWFSKGSLKRNVLDIYLTTFSESVTWEIQNLWGSSFFSKYLKYNLDFQNTVTNWVKVFRFWDNCIWIGIVKLSLWEQDTCHRQPMCYKKFQDLACQSQRLFLTKLPWYWSMNMKKPLWSRFKQCLGTFTMLLVEGFS